ANVGTSVDWGYLPIGYFGVDERFGNRSDFQALVDLCHQHGIAVNLILYEINVGEFGGDLDRVENVVAYLADLGVNAVESHRPIRRGDASMAVPESPSPSSRWRNNWRIPRAFCVRRIRTAPGRTALLAPHVASRVEIGDVFPISGCNSGCSATRSRRRQMVS